MTNTIPSNFHIRDISLQDNEAIATIIRETMTEYDCVGEGYSIEDAEVDMMYQSFAHDQSRYWVIVDDNGNVYGGGGIAPLEGSDGDICELKKMYFMSDLRGQGFGKKIIELCLDEAKSLGYEKCYLETVERMTAANKLYQKYGFKPLTCNMGDTGHSSCDLYYVLTL